MSIENVRRFFTDRGLEDPVFELEDSTATVALAAQTIGVQPGEIAKTLSFKLKERYILVVTRGDAKIDNRKYKDNFGEKARMLDAEEVVQVTGHPVGGGCPFGLANPLDIYLDISLKAFQKVFPAAGSKNSALGITPEEMLQLTEGKWVDVCQDLHKTED
jgi:prolyl-tRNA editing enzyme YbaK/EbsC (Cys-tRNA(Pro) deacylase)